MYPFKNVEEYTEFTKQKQRNVSTKLLLAQARQAAAWGVPSHESTGYTHSELCSIIYRLIEKIEELDSLHKQ